MPDGVLVNFQNLMHLSWRLWQGGGGNHEGMKTWNLVLKLGLYLDEV